ncbi:BMP family lipoprotein [Candidatus Leptofilum sp.]|uniref:BMP family lipoprotein n=1 Tax=Candidatus Leptofilum sp. TaxID=3241576 RepID=UPI003B5A5A1E
MMKNKTLWLFFVAMMALALVLAACGGEDAADTSSDDADTAVTDDTSADEDGEEAMDEEPFVFGLIMVGPREDRGWNQAHWEAAQYILENVPNSELVWFDKLNPADNPDLTVEQVTDDLVEQGAQLIITNSAEMADGTNNAALSHPDVYFIHASGDDALTGDAPDNVSNIMGQMEFGKMIAGCAAALSSDSGNIAYLGPLIDAETRRLVNSTYLGARYCWENYKDGNPDDIVFNVTWIGFWFNIPGVTLDPTQVANDFVDNGAEVIISGIDTTEGLVVAGQRADAGDNVTAIPYDYEDACAEAEEICLGVPFFNWGPSYLAKVQSIQAGNWEQTWEWVGPDWSDLNNKDTSAIGWVNGPALGDNQANLDAFVAGLADGSINLFTGPLNYQDGSAYVADGETATDEQIWYTEQLLEGIIGASE